MKTTIEAPIVEPKGCNHPAGSRKYDEESDTEFCGICACSGEVLLMV